MRPRDKKAIITKAVRRYIGEGLLIKKLHLKSTIWMQVDYDIIITPNSDMLLLIATTGTTESTNRVSIPRFSDYAVRLGTFDKFIELFNPKPLEKPDETNPPRT